MWSKKVILTVVIFFEIIIILIILNQGSLRITDFISIINPIEYNTTPKYPPQFFIPSNDTILIAELKPNFIQLFDGYVTRLSRETTVIINSDGFRDKEYSIEKPNNTIRIIVLGDSVAFGWGVNNDETFSEFLEEMLNNYSKNRKYEVLNLAFPGDNTEQEVRRLEVKGLKYNPDMIIIGYHRNDIFNNTRFAEYYDKYKKSLEENTNFSKYEIEVKAGMMAGQMLESESLVNYERENWETIYTPWQELINLSKEKKFDVIIVTDIEMFQDNFHLRVMEKILLFFKEKVLSSKNWYILDLQPVVMKYQRENLVVHPLDGHASPYAHEIIAKEIFIFMKNKYLLKED